VTVVAVRVSLALQLSVHVCSTEDVEVRHMHSQSKHSNVSVILNEPLV